MSISFNEIPRDRREPGNFIEIDPTLALRGLQGLPHKSLIMGQRLATGETPAGELVLITDPEQAAKAFGRGSMAHMMCVNYRRANESTELWAIGIDDAGTGVTAVKRVTIGKTQAGEDFGSGTLSLWVGGRLIRVGVSSADTPAEVAANIVAEATNPELAAVLTIDDTFQVQINVTAKHAGALGNDIDVRVNYQADEVLPGNMTVAIATETAGATDPTIDATLAVVDGEWWTEIVTPYLDGANVATLNDFMASNFDALAMRDNLAYGVEPGTLSEVFAGTQTRNGPHLSLVPHQNAPRPTWERAAKYAGICAFQLQIDPARQLKSLPMPDDPPPAIEDRFTPEEMDLLLNNGISSTRVIGGETRLWRCVTTYRVSDAGANDTSFLDLTTMALLRFLRWSEDQRILLRFPRHKLANDGTRFGQGQAIVTPEIMRGELIALYREWEEAGLVENADFFKERLLVERDSGDPNRLNSLQTPDLINNLRVFAAKIQFRL
ncbi:MAG: phage tail sheath C-terminal domain-containing protein [Pseudomonadota bacterium]